MTWDWNFAFEIFPQLLAAARITVMITVISFGFAIFGGLGILWLQRSRFKAISRPAIIIADFIRATPLLVQVFFLYFIAPAYGIKMSAATTGIVAMGIHYSCYMAEVYRAGMNAVHRGQWEAATALGMHPLETYRKIILPQMYPIILPMGGSYLIYMFKDTPILSAITVREMMQVSSRIGAENFRYLEPVTIVGILFLVMSVAASLVVKYAEKRTSFPGA